MNFPTDIDKFIGNHQNEKISVFFHTSAVQEALVNLKSFFQRGYKNVYAYIPENCVYELGLLSQDATFPKYREKAAYLLNSCSTVNAWSYRNMFSYKNKFLSSYHCDIALFVFYEPLAAAEFSKRMGTEENVFILSYDPYKINSGPNFPIPAGLSINRPCKPLNNVPSSDPYELEDILIIKSGSGQVVKEIKMSELKKFHGGGEALLFKAPSMPGKLLKIYNYCPGEYMVKKLKLLIGLGSMLSGCVLPTELVYRKGKCVGYVMNRVAGSDMNCVLSDYSDYKRKELIRNISVVLLELRMAQFIVSDLSAGNIHIGSDGKIRVIDCDSMECYCYPGGGVTRPYGHPDVTEDYFYKKLRTADQVNFSYAVMLFEILMGWKDPLVQKGLGDADPEWRKNKFPYTSRNGLGAEAEGVKTNEQKLKLWCQQPSAVRNGFEDVFTFKTTYDIGEWMKIMNIC